MKPRFCANGLSARRLDRKILIVCGWLVVAAAPAACTASVGDSDPEPSTGGTATSGGAAGSGGRLADAGGRTSGGVSSGGSGSTVAGAPIGGGRGGNAGSTGGAASGGAEAGGAEAGGAPVVGPLPASCAEAAAAYHVESLILDASWVPFTGTSGFNDFLFAEVPVAVGDDNQVYVGFTRADSPGYSAVIAPAAGGDPIVIPDAMSGGLAVTNDGFGVLLFDPVTNVDERTWAAVTRVKSDGSEVFQTDLFRSENLDDEGTKGAPSTSRLGYVPGSDQLVAYLAHTQRYDDGVRHQGGYLATLDASGTQTLLSGWFGSHNLDQRLLVRADDAFVLGLGDAYPEGIFFSQVKNRPETEVLQPLASAGNGATNGQLGGIVELDAELVIPFVTNRAIPEDLDAGTWPDIDEAIADQIRDAAGKGTDLGLLLLSDDGSVPGSLEPVWLDPMLASGARIERLKSARYGDAPLVWLAWAEVSGSGRQAMTRYFTMVVDKEGSVCQPKTELPFEFAFNAGDDIVRRPDGALVWANVASNAIRVVTLIPG